MELHISKIGDRLVTASGKPIGGQELGTPDICSDGSLCLAFGSEDQGPVQEVCDRIYAIRPGSYVAEQVMAYPPTPGTQSPDYLGAGAALARADGRYFALVQCGNARLKQSWLAWAWSDEGTYWWFLARDGHRTANPYHSLPIISKPGLPAFPSEAQAPLPLFWHCAMAYDASRRSFDAAIGVASTWGGIYATWWRIDYDPSNYGLGPIRNRGMVSGPELPSDDTWMQAAQWPNEAVDPMAIVIMDGGSRLFFYAPAKDAFASPTPIAYCLEGEAPKLLDTSPLYAKWSSAPGNPSGNYISVYLSDARHLRGYVAVSPDPPPATRPPRQGLLEIELEIVG